MAQPYVGEIRMFGGNFEPNGWRFCNGQLLPIAENEALFQLIGTTYGGDGQSTFALPNLQSRVPVHMGTSTTGTTYQIGEMAGVEEVTLTVQQIPVHNHVPMASSTIGNSDSPAGNVWAASNSRPYASAGAPYLAMNPATITPVGGSQPHENMIPFTGINYIISLFGIYPSPT